MLSLFPAQAATFNAALTASLATIPDGAAENLGVALGANVAAQMLTLRANDGSAAVVAYTPGTDPGDWQPTPPANAAALLPQWADLIPFAMNTPSQFSPSGIPSLTSAEYTAAFNEVKAIGDINSTTRTADQTDIARFWANGGGTATPPGHLNVMARVVAEQKDNSLSENARLFAMLNVALADAAIMAWDAKYETEYLAAHHGDSLGRHRWQSRHGSGRGLDTAHYNAAIPELCLGPFQLQRGRGGRAEELLWHRQHRLHAAL